jgi:hypothetical protein
VSSGAHLPLHTQGSTSQLCTAVQFICHHCHSCMHNNNSGRDTSMSVCLFVFVHCSAGRWLELPVRCAVRLTACGLRARCRRLACTHPPRGHGLPLRPMTRTCASRRAGALHATTWRCVCAHPLPPNYHHINACKVHTCPTKACNMCRTLDLGE